jgi:ATP-dependent NAD(P)H-hydrate dehydratase
VIVQKGETDLIACGSLPVLRCADHGSPRRCGGQGDVLAGLTTTFAAWAIAKARGDGEPAQMQQAALAACLVTRRAARLAFAARKRSMVAGDLIEHVGEVVEELAPAAHTAGS